MRKQSKYIAIAVAMLGVSVFAGCVPSSMPQQSTNTPSEAVSEEVVEMPEVTAETVMNLVDELTKKYPYNDSEHIKTLVIGANMSYLSKEDLDTILEEYGYTLEALAIMYAGEDGVLSEAYAAYKTTYNAYDSGNAANLAKEEDYRNRILLQDIMLNPQDRQLAEDYDEILFGSVEVNHENSEQYVKCLGDIDAAAQTWKYYNEGMLDIDSELSSGKQIIFSYLLEMDGGYNVNYPEKWYYGPYVKYRPM